MVWPTMSGMIVERRDQVLITRLSRLRFRSSIFFSRWSSTNGPFLSDRPIVTYLPVLWPWFPGPLGGRGAHPEPPRAPWGPRNGPGAREPLPPPPLAAAAQDHLVGGLVAAAGATLRLAPRAHRVAATGALALATAERVIDRVHGHATGVRPLAAVAVARSEEHTSELQSRPHLVCRLLLEKKKTHTCILLFFKKNKKTKK